jgi:hypothetical protein
MARKRKKPEAAAEQPVVEVPLEAAPVPPQLVAPPPALLAEGKPGNAPREGADPIADPQPMLPDSPEAVINNVLCREIQQPSPAGAETPDPNLTVLDELAKGITQGTDLNHIREDVVRLASHQPEKINVVKSILLGLDLNRIARFAQVRDKAERELARAAMRGDLKSTEYLAFLRFATTELRDITGKLDAQEVLKASGGGSDSQAMMDRMDTQKQEQEKAQAEQFKGTTPQGMEIIRKQVYKIKKRLKKAGKLKSKDGSKPEPAAKS